MRKLIDCMSTEFVTRQVTKILIDPIWWDTKAADLMKHVLIPEEDRKNNTKEMSAIRTYISEAYAIDKGKDSGELLQR